MHTRRGREGGGPPRLRSGSEDGLVDIWCPLFLFQLNLKRIHGHTRSQERVLDAEDYSISLRLDRKATPDVFFCRSIRAAFPIPSLIWVLRARAGDAALLGPGSRQIPGQGRREGFAGQAAGGL